jgi:hypothetical protein
VLEPAAVLLVVLRQELELERELLPEPCTTLNPANPAACC